MSSQNWLEFLKIRSNCLEKIDKLISWDSVFNEFRKLFRNFEIGKFIISEVQTNNLKCYFCSKFYPNFLTAVKIFFLISLILEENHNVLGFW